MLGERLGSGDGERKTLLTQQVAFEPLPASVFALGWPCVLCADVMPLVTKNAEICSAKDPSAGCYINGVDNAEKVSAKIYLGPFPQ